MLLKARLAAGIMITMVATGVAAQQSSLSNLLGAIGKIGKVEASSAANKAAMANENNDLVEILKTYAAGHSEVSPCQSANLGLPSAQSALKLGNYPTASAGFRLHAMIAAQCAVEPHRAWDAPQMTLIQAFDEVGLSLATSVVADKAGGMSTPETLANAKNALALLSANKAGNAEAIQKLKDTGLVGEPGPATASSEASIVMTAPEAVNAFKSNSFAFKSKYDGKVLTISGNVQNITGSGQQALVTLVGYKPTNMDDQGFQDLVRCTITDSAALAKVMDLKKGQATTVTGLFKPDQDVLGIGIGLQRCQIN